MDQTPTTKRTSKKRDEILSQAVKLFNESGYHDTRLEDIASQLGKAKTSVSYHFQSKEALLEEAFTQSCAFTDKEISLAAQERNGLERVLRLVRNRAELHASALSGRIPPIDLLYSAETAANVSNPQLRSVFSAQVQTLHDFIDQGQIDTSIKTASAEAATFFIMNTLHWIPEWLVNLPNAQHSSAIDGLCAILRNGISSSADRPPSRPSFKVSENNYPEIFNRDVRSQLKRDAILRTGTRFLNLQGFRNLSLNDLAGELGVTRGAFYYYIADKEALLDKCFERSFQTIETCLINARRQDHTDHLALLEHALYNLFEGHITGLEPLIRMNLLNAVSPVKRMSIEAKLKRVRASYSEIIAGAMVDNSVRAIDLNTVETLIMGSVFSASQWRLSVTPMAQTWKPSLDPSAAARTYFQPLLTGLAAR